MKNWRIYVFMEFEPDYSEGMAFAVATSLDEAKKLIHRHYRGHSSTRTVDDIQWGKYRSYPLKKMGRGIGGGM